MPASKRRSHDEYPAWKDITIRRLLNMTSGIANYSETEWMSRAWADEPKRDFTFKELVAAAHPTVTQEGLGFPNLPPRNLSRRPPPAP